MDNLSVDTDTAHEVCSNGETTDHGAYEGKGEGEASRGEIQQGNGAGGVPDVEEEAFQAGVCWAKVTGKCTHTVKCAPEAHAHPLTPHHPSGFPFWPGRYAKISEVSPEVKALKRTPAARLVYFFGTAE